MRLLPFLRKMRRSFSSYKPLIEVLISRDAIVHNLAAYQKAALPAQIAPVIKSNAYGHGLFEIAHILDTQDVPFIVVDSLYEARMLRHDGIKKSLLVIGYTPTENIHNSLPKNTAVTVGALEQIAALATTKSPVPLHVKIDTGMHRQGIMPEDIPAAIQILKAARNITLLGICSHLADSDNEDPAFTKKQIAVWDSAVAQFKKEFPSLKYWHLAASAGIRYNAQIHANVGRLGKGLYGINPVPSWPIDLRPALEMRSIISAIRTLPAGERIGYSGTFETPREMRVATIPVGYYEGTDRRLSNKGVYLVNGISCPIVGRVSMNISSIDISAVPQAKVGDPVIIISANREAPNSTENIAKLCDTISYEILVHIPTHLSRKIV
jgi:alanine racemase